jgi:hypothetical protein
MPAITVSPNTMVNKVNGIAMLEEGDVRGAARRRVGINAEGGPCGVWQGEGQA